MTELLTDKGVVLVGEAAKSWVHLQWTEFFVCTFLVIGFLSFVAFCIYNACKD